MRCEDCKIYHKCSTQLIGEEDVEAKCKIFKTRQNRKGGIKKTKAGLVKYDSNGRRRKNWIKLLKQKSRRFLKSKCERCPSKKNLTIHHKKQVTAGSGVAKGVQSYEELMRLILDPKNCETLCRDCHDEEEGMAEQQKNIKTKSLSNNKCSVA